MRRMGHRGAMGHAPENTIASFQKAIDLGCDEIETDVWLTADGLVISHDRPQPGDGLPLDTVLDFCRGRLSVNVELKCDPDESQAARTGDRVARHLAARADPALSVSTFWWPALVAARDAAPEVRRAFLFNDCPDRAALLSSAGSLDLFALHPNRAFVTAGLVADAHGAGLKVHPWTVNDPAEIAAFVGLGVDGIMSDYPERIPRG
ncbi:MAG TPA: glycerophosphodiester phosphodiesterase [Candidatus Saccharimonadales bacterium]|nr:glycerophosphodiester phosphodiesterase [Candidatus Saccharimonadales bacterium]